MHRWEAVSPMEKPVKLLKNERYQGGGKRENRVARLKKMLDPRKKSIDLRLF